MSGDAVPDVVIRIECSAFVTHPDGTTDKDAGRDEP